MIKLVAAIVIVSRLTAASTLDIYVYDSASTPGSVLHLVAKNGRTFANAFLNSSTAATIRADFISRTGTPEFGGWAGSPAGGSATAGPGRKVRNGEPLHAG